jgi:hypothetical protein
MSDENMKLLWSGIRKLYRSLVPLLIRGAFEITILVLLIKILLKVS